MPGSDAYSARINTIVDEYFQGNPSLADAQQLLRTIILHASYTFIGANKNQIVASGGPHQVGPHRETCCDPVILVATAALSATEMQSS